MKPNDWTDVLDNQSARDFHNANLFRGKNDMGIIKGILDYLTFSISLAFLFVLVALKGEAFQLARLYRFLEIIADVRTRVLCEYHRIIRLLEIMTNGIDILLLPLFYIIKRGVCHPVGINTSCK